MAALARIRPDLGITGLAYGCAALTSASSRRDSVHLLECAYENGIRHFDVARLYGMGLAEEILGACMHRRRDRITIATKLGIVPPRSVQAARSIVGPIKRILRRFPRLERTVKRRINAGVQSGRFSQSDARASLDASLRALRTDYVDFLLLHEATAAEANQPELLEFLAKELDGGRIRAHGIAGDFKRFHGDCFPFDDSHKVFQFQNNIEQQNVRVLKNCGGRTCFTFGAVAPLATLRRLRIDPAVSALFRERTGVDLVNDAEATGLLLSWATQSNPNGVVIFSSTSQNHIRRNIEFVRDKPFTASVLEELERVFSGPGGSI